MSKVSGASALSAIQVALAGDTHAGGGHDERAERPRLPGPGEIIILRIDPAHRADITAMLATPGAQLALTSDGQLAIRLANGGIVAFAGTDALVADFAAQNGLALPQIGSDPDALLGLFASATGSAVGTEPGHELTQSPLGGSGMGEGTLLGDTHVLRGGQSTPTPGAGGLNGQAPLTGGIAGSPSLAEETNRWGRDDLKRGEAGEKGLTTTVMTGTALEHMTGLGDEELGHRNGEKLVSSDNTRGEKQSSGVGSDMGHLGGLGDFEYRRSSSDEDEADFAQNSGYALPLAPLHVIPPLISGPLAFTSDEDHGLASQLFNPAMLGPAQPLRDIVVVLDPAAGTLVLNTDGTFTYTPAPGYSGATGFDFSFTDPRTGATITGHADLTVAAIADAPALAGSASGNEDAVIALPMTIGIQDPDGSESLQSVVITGVPTGAILAWNTLLSGTVTPDGHGGFTITGSESEIRAVVASLTLRPPLNYSGAIHLDIAATSVEDHADPAAPGFGTTATTHLDYIVTVAPVADKPPLTVDALYTTDEDVPVALTSLATSLVDTDGSEQLTITITGVPSGALFDRGTNLGGGSWSFTAAEIAAGLSFTPPPNANGTFSMVVTSSSTEQANGDTQTTTAPFDVVVAPVIDSLDVISSAPAGGPEDTPILFGDKIGITIHDPDGSEILTRVVVSGIPTGGTIDWNHAIVGGTITDLGGGSLEITGGETAIRALLASMSVTPPLHDATDFSLTVSATSQDGGPTGPTSTQSIVQGIVVAPVADTPSVHGGTFATEEDTPVALTGVTGALVDADGSESLSFRLESVPAGASFAGKGTDLGGGVWSFTPADIAGGLTFAPPLNEHGTFDMTLRIVATEIENGDAAQSSALVRVVVDAQADAPSVTTSTASGNEDTAIPFGHLVAVSPVDADGSEHLQSVTIAGLPSGSTLSWNAGLPGSVSGSGSGPYTITGTELQIRALLATFAYMPPHDGDANVSLSVTATQLDADGSTAATTISQPIVVAAVADAPTGHGAGSGPEDTFIAVPITVALSDVDGSETLQSVTVTGLPVDLASGGAVFRVVSGSGTQLFSDRFLGSFPTTDSAGSAYVVTGDGAGNLTFTGSTAGIQAALASLQIQRGQHIGDDFSLSVTATTVESNLTGGEVAVTTASTTFSVPVTIVAVADQPTAIGGTYLTEEDTPVALTGVGGALVDADGSESLSFRITGVPTGASFGGAGSNLGGGNWSFTPAEIAGGISFTPPANAHGTYNMTLVSTATESENGSTATNSAPIVVTVDAQADAPSVTTNPVTGVEDANILFGNQVAITLADGDGSEHLSSVTISGLPSGATLAWSTLLPGSVAGSGSGPYTISGTESQIRGLLATFAYHPPLNDDTNRSLTIAATTTDADGSTATTTISQPITVRADADAPAGHGAGSGNEDTFIAVPITVSLADTDGSETLQSATVSGLPIDLASGGAVFRLVSGSGTQLFSDRFMGSFPTTDGAGNAYTVTGDGAGNLTFTGSTAGIENALASLEIKRGLNIADDFTLSVTATTVESNPTDSGMATPTASTTFSVPVTVVAVADQPGAVGGTYATEEDTPVALAGIGGALVDTDGSESLSFQISGVPAGATFSAGSNLGGGVWAFTPAQIAGGISFTPPLNQHGTFNMTLVSTSTEAENGSNASNSAPIVVVVDAQVDGAVPAAATASGNEDQPISFGAGITWTHRDTDGSEAVTQVEIASVPAGWTVTYTPTGASAIVTPTAGGYIVTGNEADIRATLNTFAIQAPLNRDEDTSLDITITTRDADGSTITASVAQPVRVNAIADTPSATGGAFTTDEDTPVALTGIGGVLVDADGSETLTFRVSGVPAGASFTTGTNLGGGVWSFTAAQVAAGLTFNPVAQWSGTVNMTLTATATEHTVAGENLTDDIASRTAPITITVNPVLDVPVVNGTSSTVNEDTQFNLGANINVTVADLDGSQSMGVTLTNALGTAAWTNQSGVTVTNLGGGTYTLVGANAATVLTVLNSFKLTPPSNSDANFTVGISVLTTEAGGANATITGTHDVIVRAVADRPTVSITGTGNEDTFISTPVAVNLADTDGSETISQVRITGVPTDTYGSGAHFRLVDGASTVTLAGNYNGSFSGTDASGNAYTVAGNGSGQLTFTGSSSGIRNAVASLAIQRGDNIGNDFTLSVVATSTESNPTLPGGEIATLNASNTAVNYVVNVIPITDPVTATAPASLVTEEDTPIRLALVGFGATQVDTDGSETLSYRFSSLPGGATFVDGSGASIGTNAGGGVWTLTAAQLANAYFKPPLNQYGGYTFDFAAITNESEGTSSPQADTKTVSVHVAPNPDPPAVSGSTVVVEDQTANFGSNIAYSLVDTDGSEKIVEVQIGDIPAGWTVSFTGGSMPSNVTFSGGFYTVTGTEAQIRAAVGTFQIKPPLNDDGDRNPAVPDAQITVRVTTEDDPDTYFNNGDRATTEVKHDLTIQAAADTPIAVAAHASGTEDTLSYLWPAGVGVNVALTDTDGSETLSAALTGIPATWTVVASAAGGGTYTRAADGSIAVTGSEAQINAILDSIQVQAPLNYSGVLSGVQLAVTATEAATGSELATRTATTTTSFDITVAAVADTPLVSVVPAIAGNAGFEDTPIKLAFTSQLVDRDGSESLWHELRGLPAGATFTNASGTPIGTDMGGGVWRFTPAEVAVLHVLPERDSNLDFTLQVRAIAVEDHTIPPGLPGAGDQAASAWVALPVEVIGVADRVTPVIAPTTSPEDVRFPLGLAIGGTLADVDLPQEAANSESLYFVITGLPSTIVPSHATYIGIGWQVAAADMPSVTVPVPADFSGDYLTLAPGLAVRAVTQENDGNQTYGSVTFAPGQLLVSPVADGFATWSPGIQVSEGNAIPLSSLANHGFSDNDGSESVVSYTVDLNHLLTDAGIAARLVEMYGPGAGLSDFIAHEITGSFTNNGNGTITVTPAQVASLGFRASAFLDSNQDFALPVTALVRDTAGALTNDRIETGSLSVDLVGVADAPTVHALPSYSGMTGTLVDLNPGGTDFGGESTDRDAALGRSSSESSAAGGDLYYVVSNLDAAMALVDHNNNPVGQNNNDGSWILRPADLADLRITCAPGYTGTQTLFLTTIAVENDGDRASNTTSFTVQFTNNPGGGGSSVAPLPPIVTIGPATGTEDNALALNIQVAFDPAERLDLNPRIAVVISGIPAGFTIQGATFNPANGKWVASESAVESGTVRLLPPTDFSGPLPAGLTVEATITNSQFGHNTSGEIVLDGSAYAPLPTWSPVADGPAIGLTHGTAIEDHDIAIAITIAPRDVDASSPETVLTPVLVRVPAGYSLSAGTPTGTPGEFSLTAAQLTGLTLIAPAVPSHDHTTAVQVSVTASTNEPGAGATATQVFSIPLIAEADAPHATSANATGSEDAAISLAGLSAALVDTDGSELLSVKISGIPADSLLSAGGNNGDGSWTIPVAVLSGLAITPPKDWSGVMSLSLDVYSLEQSNGDVAQTSIPFTVTVNGVADRVTLAPSAVSLTEDASAALPLSLKLEDATATPESVEITFSGLPAGSSLHAGSGTLVDLGGGSWRFTGSEAEANAIFFDAGHSGGSYTLGMSVVTIDGLSRSVPTLSSLDVTVTPVADTPSLTVNDAAGAVLSPIALNIYTAFPDLDGSETHVVQITGVPTGGALSAGTSLGGGAWQLTPAELSGLAITVPGGTSSFSLGVTTTATETANGSLASVAGTVNVAIGSGGITLAGTGAGETLTGGPGGDTLHALGGDDILIGGRGADSMSGGSGSDTFRWVSGDAGTGTDQITDFTPGAGGDKLDISALLSGYVGGVSNIADFVSLSQSGGNTTVSIDANGAAGGSSFSALVVLQGVTGVDVNALKANGNLIA